MKRLIVTAVLLCYMQLNAAEKHALIIALGTYLPETKWGKINSEKDVEIIKDALLSAGFKESNIHIYTDGLTKEGILAALDKDLINNSHVKFGDVAYFHFSGHGQQVYDDNGDELDGLDEAIVPIDAPRKSTYISSSGNREKYNGKKHLRDDLLRTKLDALRGKLGQQGNLLVTIDACHSGTATRGLGHHRGSSEPIVPEGWKPLVQKESDDSNWSLGAASTSELAPMVCFMASGQNELNSEYKLNDSTIFGSLTYALCKALMEADSKTTYRGLFETVKNTMAAIVSEQTPQVEGELDQLIFGGQLTTKPIYFNITQWLNNDAVEINGGVLNGLNAGSIVAFYPAETRNLVEVKPLAVGKVVSAGIAKSKVLLSKGTLEKESILKTWVFVKEKKFGEMAVKLYLDIADKSNRDSIVKYLKDYAFIELVKNREDANLLLEYGFIGSKTDREIRITTFEDKILFQEQIENSNGKGVSKQQFQKAIEKVSNFSQARFLRGLEVQNADLKAEIIVLPLKLKEGPSGKGSDSAADFVVMEADSIRDKSGSLRIYDKTNIRIDVRNNSQRKIYYTVLDIDPENNISVIYPSGERSASEYQIPALNISDNKDLTFGVGPPYGTYVMKLIVSTKALDFQSIASTRGTNASIGSGTAIENLFKQSFKSEGTRSPVSKEVGVEDIGVYTLMYSISPTSP